MNTRTETDPAGGPDIALVGAARSGTSYLAAALANHPAIDPCATKEPDFFSIQVDRGDDWYDSLFRPHRQGLLRLDASVSYTYPQHPMALERLRSASPGVRLVYTVREPLQRMVSHYHFMRYYGGRDDLGTFSEALAAKPMFLGSSDYAAWLAKMSNLFGRDRVVVVPFPLIIDDLRGVLEALCSSWGLSPAPRPAAGASAYRNSVREFRHPMIRSAQQFAHANRLYPVLRRVIGPARFRKVRSILTKPVDLPSIADEMRTLPEEYLLEMQRVASTARAAVNDWLAEQDESLGLEWSSVWRAHADVAWAHEKLD